MIERARNRALVENQTEKLVFDYAAYGTRVSTLERYRGKEGWLTLRLIEVEALGRNEQHLLLAACTKDGDVLAEDDPEKLLRLPARVETGSGTDGETLLRADLDARKHVLLQEIEQRSLGYFDQEVQKLDAWADDLKLGLVQDIDNLDQEIKEVRRKAARAMTLAEKVSLQKQQREMDSKLKKMRQELYVQQDRIDERRGALIGELEGQLEQVVRERVLFLSEWGML